MTTSGGGCLDMRAIDKCIDFRQPGVYFSCTGDPESTPQRLAQTTELHCPIHMVSPGTLAVGRTHCLGPA